MSNLEKHAEYELRKAGLFDDDSDYDGQLAAHVMNLIREFSRGGHSGGSAWITVDLFSRLARYQPLTALTNDPEEWEEIMAPYAPTSEEPLWQSRRDSRMFSNDGGKTYYSVEEFRTGWRRKLFGRKGKTYTAEEATQ